MLALHTSGHAFAGGEGWLTDIDAAKKTASESKKDLLIDFTGSDWCGWCIKLNDEVFKHDAFKTGVKDSFVLVEIDFPREKGKLPEDARKRNTELGEKYAVESYPTILLCDAEGKPYAATGYEEGGPEKYVGHLNELRKNKVKRDEAFAKAANPGTDPNVVDTDGDGRSDWDEAKSQSVAIDQSYYPFGHRPDRDKIGDDGSAVMIDRNGVLIWIDKEGKAAKAIAEQILTRAAILATSAKFDEALKAIDEAKAFAPDSKMAPMIEQFRKRIEQGKEEAAKKAPEAGAEKKAE
jgi:thioredoxin-related protein